MCNGSQRYVLIHVDQARDVSGAREWPAARRSPDALDAIVVNRRQESAHQHLAVSARFFARAIPDKTALPRTSFTRRAYSRRCLAHRSLSLFTSASWTSPSPTRGSADYCNCRRRSCISGWLAGIGVFPVAGIVAPKRFFECSGIKVILTARRET